MKKILVIESQTQTRNSFLECLKAQGFCTMSAENGLLGVQRAQQDLPDLITSAIMIPELDGYGVLATLRKNPVTSVIPLIFVAAKKRKADIRKAMELGADDYLVKPCKLDELLRAISACLEKRAILQQWYITHSQLVPGPPSANTAVSQAAVHPIFPSHPQLSEVFHFIEANYNKPIRLQDVAHVVGYSNSYLTNLVRRHTGKTVYQWIVERRMEAARLLLVNTNQTVDHIAMTVGYQDAAHFFQQFRQFHGTTPHVWRKSQSISLTRL